LVTPIGPQFRSGLELAVMCGPVEIAFDDYVVVLIAGWFARRIKPYVEPGDTIDRGARIGQIAFGSRADVVLPEDYDHGDLAVAEGDSVRAGESVIASQ
jgi:phosphatidylserine decarboxylase